MRFSLLFILVLALLAIALAKPHNHGKRTQHAKRNKEHKITNTMDHSRREHRGTQKTRPSQHRNTGGHKHPTTHRPHLRDLDHQHVTQRTDKKHDYMLRRGETVGKHLLTNRVPQGDAPIHLLTNRTPLVPVNSTNKGKNSTKSEISMESEGLIHATQGAPWRQENFAPRHQSPHKQHNANKPPKKYDARKHALLKKTYGKDKKEKGHRVNTARMH